MAKTTKLKEGDIFYVKVNEKYIFARLLMDVDSRVLTKEPGHKVKFYSGCYLIEVYKGMYDTPQLTTNDIIVPSQYAFKKFFYSKNYKVEWNFYRHEPIDYTKIDFPEHVETGKNGIINFRKFDLSIPTNTLRADFIKRHNLGTSFSLYTGSICPSFYQLVDEAFHLQGRDEMMQVRRTHFLDKNDLRFVPDERTEFYNQISADTHTSYYDLALKHGYDLARFY